MPPRVGRERKKREGIKEEAVVRAHEKEPSPGGKTTWIGQLALRCCLAPLL